MKKITTVGGTSLLIWLLFSPVIGIYLYTKIPEDWNTPPFFVLSSIVLAYLIFGLVAYYVTKLTGGFFAKTQTDTKPQSKFAVIANHVGFTSLNYFVWMLILFEKINGFDIASATFIYLTGSVAILILSIHHASNYVPKDYPALEEIVRKSTLWFSVVALGFTLFLMNIAYGLQQQLYLWLFALMLVISIPLFYFVSRKVLVPTSHVVGNS